jgi:uncharacterized protein Yka (UPF0111/DUF47 family)
MTGKIEIVRELGEQALLLPMLLADALAANDRLKLRLTLLQEAAARAHDPDYRLRDFHSEREASGLADPQYDRLVTGARTLSGEQLLVPGAKSLIAGIAPDLGAMLAPLKAAGTEDGRPLEERLKGLVARLPEAKDDQLAISDLQAMTSARRDGPDSVHLLVMDAHRAVNRLSAETAVEEIDGARVHHVEAGDRLRIKAFMAGLNRTAGLAFGHPGLGTTATRVGPGLLIQNDIGTTDAHVLVIHVDQTCVRVTYTDVHRLRAKFFISLFEDQGMEWSPLAEQNVPGLADDEMFYLVTGRFTAPDDGAMDRLLNFLGSRIVFLIDWNKARKALQAFVGKDVAIDILRWAAGHDYGHRAFLELGGVDLVFDAIRRAATGRVPYGARLDQTLGTNESAQFLKRILQLTCDGLRAARSVRLIRDEIQAELAQLFDTAEFGIFIILLRHLGGSRMLAAAIAEAFAQDHATLEADRSRLTANAKRLEEKGDRLTVEAREICAHMQHAESLRTTIDAVESATDSLDECAFLFSLIPKEITIPGAEALAELAGITVESFSEMVRAIEAASRLPEGQRADADESLRAIDAVVLAERRADTAERTAFAAFTRAPSDDARILVLGLEVTRALETATDYLAHAALSLRERVLEELSA